MNQSLCRLRAFNSLAMLRLSQSKRVPSRCVLLLQLIDLFLGRKHLTAARYQSQPRLKGTDRNASITIDQLAFRCDKSQSSSAQVTQLQRCGQRFDKPSCSEQRSNERFMLRIKFNQSISSAKHTAQSLKLDLLSRSASR